MYRLRRHDEGWLHATLARLSTASLTYPSNTVGATNDPKRVPAGYRSARFVGDLGRGDEVFTRAAGGVRHWEMFRGAGLDVHPTTPAADEGTTVLTVLNAGPVHVVIPCRVVYVVDEADRAGFAYGTLPGHPVQGEECFVVDRQPDGQVRFVVNAFSRPADLVGRLGAPVARRVQSVISRRYVTALKDYCSGS